MPPLPRKTASDMILFSLTRLVLKNTRRKILPRSPPVSPNTGFDPVFSQAAVIKFEFDNV
jgi:hypothetical protein